MADSNLAEVFGSLDIQASDEPLPTFSRSRESLPNPFGDPIKASVEHSTPYSIYVPVDAVPRAVFLLNAAARKADLGVRIVVNVQRDENGALVKDDKGKAVPVVEKRGDNKGKVLIRFQGKAERKQTAPRPYSIVNDPDNKGAKMLRRRSDKAVIARGTHDEMRAELARLKAGAAAA